MIRIAKYIDLRRETYQLSDFCLQRNEISPKRLLENKVELRVIDPYFVN